MDMRQLDFKEIMKPILNLVLVMNVFMYPNYMIISSYMRVSDD